MMFRFAAARIAPYLLLAVALAGCADCAREGCDELRSAAADEGPGIAGVIVQQSDVSVDGCMECPFADADVGIWWTDSEVSTVSAASDIMRTADPAFVQVASKRFHAALDPGHYLLCVRPNCVNIHVEATTVTANVKRRKGPTSFFVTSDASQKPTEDFGLEVGY